MPDDSMPEKLLGASIFLNVVIKLNRGLQQKISSVLGLFIITFRSFPNVFISLVGLVAKPLTQYESQVLALGCVPNVPDWFI